MKKIIGRSHRTRTISSLGRLGDVGVSVAAAAALVVGFAGAASATSGTGGAVEVGPSAGVSPAAAQASSLFAGYYVTPSHAFASASATFVVPKLTCSSTSTEQYLGLNDLDPTDDSTSVLASVLAGCSSGTASYYYDATIGGVGGPQPGIHAGDTVQVSIYQTGSIEEPKVFDITADKYYDAYTTLEADTSIDIGDLVGTTTGAQFGKISFTQVQVNGQYVSFEPNVQYDLLNGAKTLVKTSKVPTNGDSFSLKFKASS